MRTILLLLAALFVLIAWRVGVPWYSNSEALNALALNIYWEAGTAKEPELGMRMVAYVTHQRALKNRPFWGGSEIVKVVYARHTGSNGRVVCQFSWTCMSVKNQVPKLHEKWQEALHIAREELAGKFVPPDRFVGATSYLNPHASARKNICEFKRTLVYLGKIDPHSRHVFYREPTNYNERSALPKIKNIPEC